MIKIILVGLIIVFGLLHLLGFVKAYKFADIKYFNKPVTQLAGIIWLIAAIMFVTSAILLMAHNNLWLLSGIVAVAISQILIISAWQDMKLATIVNIIITLMLVLSTGSYIFEQSYRQDVAYNLSHNTSTSEEIITQEDIEYLPIVVQKYLTYVGVVGKPKVNNVHIVFEGEMREEGKDFFSFTGEQYNFFEEPARLFFMKGRLFGVSVPGYHKYMNSSASMDIRLFGLLKVVDLDGEILDEAETVTVFNDMCLMAPSSLIDDRIQWEEIDELTVKGTFTNNGISVSAMLYFNAEGQLINFVSDDRTAVSDMKKYKFSTPISDYRDFDGYRLPSYGELIWHYPEGDFMYGKIHLKSITYNVEED